MNFNFDMASIVWGVFFSTFLLLILTGKIVFGDKKKSKKE